MDKIRIIVADSQKLVAEGLKALIKDADELEVIGSHGMQAHRYSELLDMIQAGELRPDLLIGNTISLEQAVLALPQMNNFPGAGVTVIDRF